MRVQPAFRWSTSGFDNVTHVGLVDHFTFSWQMYRVDDEWSGDDDDDSDQDSDDEGGRG